MVNTKKSVMTNLIWRFAERIGAQGISFIVSIVLARLLEPEHYGQIALITVFLNILQVFVDSGLGNALIQKKDADDTDFSTVFYFNMCMCTVLYIGLFLTAPLISKFYNDMSLVPIIRVIGITLLISGIKNVQQAYVSRKMIFKKFFFATLGGTLFSAVLGIVMAYLGAGVWALVFQQLSNAFIDTVILWIVVKWRPKFVFSWARLKILFSFGWKLLLSALLDTVYNDLRQLVIGKKYTKEDLAYYNNGQKIPNLVVTNINTSIGSVLFPALSSEQDHPELVKAHVRRAIKTSSYIMWPMLLGLAACSEPVVRLLLTDKWLPAVPYLQISCFVYGMMPIHTANLQAITAMGRSDLFLRLEIIKKVIGLIVLIISMRYGVIAIAVSAIFTGILSMFINAWPNRELLHYSYREQLSDMLPAFVLSMVMYLTVLQVNRLSLSPILLLLIQVPLGMAIYLGGSAIFKLESFTFALQSVKSILQKLKKQKNA